MGAVLSILSRDRLQTLAAYGVYNAYGALILGAVLSILSRDRLQTLAAYCIYNVCGVHLRKFGFNMFGTEGCRASHERISSECIKNIQDRLF